MNGRKLLVLKARPRNPESRATLEGEASPADVILVSGYNPRPKKDDNQVRTGYDMGVLADKLGCDVYSFVRSEGDSDRPQRVENEEHPDQVSLTQLHQAKAEENLGAIEQLRSDGDLTDNPLDIMGFSDGRIVTMVMLNERPDLFKNFVITNTPGLDNASASRSYLQALRELGHLGSHAILQKLGRGRERYGPQTKLAFTRDASDGYEDSTYKSNARFDSSAIARTKSLLKFLPQILEKNPDIRGYIASTEADRIAPAQQVENALKEIPTGGRIQSRHTGWETHTMGYGTTERAQKLGNQGDLLLELRMKPSVSISSSLGKSA